MKKILCCLIVLLSASALFADAGFQGRPITNNVVMPTGHTLNQGEMQLGIGPLAFGISDRVQIGTKVLTFILGVPNVNGRVNLLRKGETSLSAGLGFSIIPMDNTRNRTFNTYYPFVAYSRPIGEATRLHLAVNLASFENESEIKDTETQAYYRGSSLDGGIEYSFSNRTKFLGEAGYDFTFEGIRFAGAVLWGWKTFRLKLGMDYYNPQGVKKAYLSPQIGLWWRFNTQN